MIVGSGITANQACTTFVNNISIVNMCTCSLLPAQYGLYYDTTTCQVFYKPL
jgi:hypothetical protein